MDNARTIVITGASDGIGAAAAGILAGVGHRVIVVGRSPEKTRAVAERVGAEHHVADFARLDEVRDLAAALQDSTERIDVLANNAGGTFAGPDVTVDGFEKTFQVNHLAPTLLTHALLPRLIESRAAVINTASHGARLFAKPDLEDLDSRGRFRAARAYGNAKLANIVSAKALHERYHDAGLSALSFHPGVIATNFAAESSGPLRLMYRTALARLLSTPEEGGAVLAYFANGEPGRDWRSGAYYDDRLRVARTHRAASDPAFVAAHWERTAQMLGIRW